MKKIYFSFIAMLGAGALSAQFQLNQGTHAPANGDQYDRYHCDSLNIAPGAGGSGASWDFSALNTYSTLVESFSATTVSGGTYSNANVGVASSPNKTAYYNSSSASLLYYGGNFNVGPIIGNLNYSSPAISASYPMGIGSSSTAAIAGSINVTSPITASGTFTGSSSYTVDAAGSMTLGGVTYTDVLRVQLNQAFSFTTNFANGGLTQLIYEYYANGTKAPLLSISMSTANIPLASQTQTTVTRLKPAPPTNTITNPVGLVAEKSDQVGLLVFPNPANAELHIVSSLQKGQVNVFDLTGSQTDCLLLNNGKAVLPSAYYPSGVYFYSLQDEKGMILRSGKFSVLH